MGKSENGIILRLITIALIGIICALFCYVILFLPIPRQIGLTFRNTLYVFPVIFLLAWACCLTKHQWLRGIFICLLFACVLLPYSGLINSGMSDQYALGGVIPWSDAFTMQLNTQRFLYGGQMGQAVAIRPLSTIFYAVFLRCFDNNYFALHVFLCVITAVCLIFSMEEVSRVYGSISGAFCFTILYFYIRQRFGTFMTEPYGFLCGLISCYWLMKGISGKKQIQMLTGFLFLSIGLNARPAAMFLFPAVGLWYFFVFLKGNSKRFLWAAAALLLMLSGFGLNRLAQIAVYGNDPIPNRQAAEMVYGLCLGGKSWGDVVGSPEMIALNDSENIIKDVAALCAPVLKEHPENIFAALKTIFWDSLIRSPYYGAFSFINGNPQKIQTFARFSLMAVWLMSIVFLISEKKRKECSFLLVCAFGITLSECAAVPFSTNYLRLYAVSMWVPACIVGYFPQFLLNKVSAKMQPSVHCQKYSYHFVSTIFGILSAIITAAAAVGPWFIKNFPLDPKSAAAGICSPDQDVLVTSVDKGSYIYLDEQPRLKEEHIPYFRLPYVRQHIHDTASVEMFPFTDAINSPTAIIRGIDLENMQDALIFAPLDIIEGKTGYAQFCGEFLDPPVLRNDRFFISDSVTFFEDNL